MSLIQGIYQTIIIDHDTICLAQLRTGYPFEDGKLCEKQEGRLSMGVSGFDQKWKTEAGCDDYGASVRNSWRCWRVALTALLIVVIFYGGRIGYMRR